MDYDKFYTNPKIAKECINYIKECIPDWEKYLWLEPSCGTGSFSDNIDGVQLVSIDIDPDVHAMKNMSFLDYEHKGDKVLLFGNPPFGRQGSNAKAFIRHGAKFSEVIAFILPRSFMKPSMYSIFPKKFHKIYEIELPKDSYLHNGIKCSVPTVFQVWKLFDINRIIASKIIPEGFRYTMNDCNLIVRRVGGRAGQCFVNDGQQYSPSSHYFIKVISAGIMQVCEQLSSHVFPDNTTGPRSISKQELNPVLNRIIAGIIS